MGFDSGFKGLILKLNNKCVILKNSVGSLPEKSVGNQTYCNNHGPISDRY